MPKQKSGIGRSGKGSKRKEMSPEDVIKTMLSNPLSDGVTLSG